jgi:peptide/nickel transport system permease protein
MQAYIAKRTLLFVPTIIMVTIAIFVLLRVVPGDPAVMLLAGGEGGGEENEYTQEQLTALRAKLGTDKPIVAQYGIWVWNMLQLDFGTSFFYETPVSEDLRQKFPVTLELSILATVLAIVVAVPLGVISAIKQDSLADYATRLITIAGVAIPNFWLAILMIFFLVLIFGWMPPIVYVSLWEDPTSNLKQLFFPALALGFSNMAFIARVTRSAMLEVFREDYIRTARSKGLREAVVVFRHALKNALLPVVTISGYEFGRLMAGTIIIEVIFMVPGMGRLLVTSIFHRDFPMIQAVIVLITVLVLVLNMALDLLYAWLNPRIRYS